MNQYQIEDLSCNHDERYIAMELPHRTVKVPFYEISRINVFSHRIGIWYKNSNLAVFHGSETIIKAKHRDLEKTGISIRNAT